MSTGKSVPDSSPRSHSPRSGRIRALGSGRRMSRHPEIASAAPLGAIAVFLLERCKAGQGGVLFLSQSERRAEHLGAILAALEPECGVMVLPRWDSLPYDGAVPSRDVTGRRASVLRRLAQKGAVPLVLTTAESALQRVPPKKIWRDAVLVLRRDLPIAEELFTDFFARTGYSLQPRVESPGEGSLRGQVIDIFPAGALGPVRVEYAEGRITSLSSFDPDTQRTTGELDQVVLDAACEIIHSEPLASRNFASPPSLSAYYGELATLFDYLDDAHIIADALIAERATGWLEHVHETYRETCEARGTHAPDLRARQALDSPEKIFLNQAEWDAALAERSPEYLLAEDPDAEMLVPVFATAISPGR